MMNFVRRLSIYGVSAGLSLTLFATNLSAARRVPGEGDGFEDVLRVVGKMLRVIFGDVLSIPK
jgi:hypothetical protein